MSNQVLSIIFTLSRVDAGDAFHMYIDMLQNNNAWPSCNHLMELQSQQYSTTMDLLTWWCRVPLVWTVIEGGLYRWCLMITGGPSKIE